MRTGYLGLGSNVGDRPGHLRAAIELLGEQGVEVEAVSSAYETEPVGEVLDQPDFLNAVIRIRTDLEPEPLLDACKAIEVERGRMLAASRHSPRTLDIDLLLLGDLELSTERLKLPHPEVTSRRFVLAPLLELNPDLALPDGTRLADALAALGGGQRAERVGALGPEAAAGALRSGCSQAGGKIGGTSPGSSGWTRTARRPAGRPSISGRRSCMVIARRMLGAIWKSAAFSCSPSIVLAALSSSTRSSKRPNALRSARTFSSLASLKWAERATIGAAVFTARPIGIPSFASVEKLRRGALSFFSAHQISWRIGC